MHQFIFVVGKRKNTLYSVKLAKSMGCADWQIMTPDQVCEQSTGPYMYVNWGNSDRKFDCLPQITDKRKWLNLPEAISLAVNKIKCFNVLASAGVPTVPFTTDKQVAKNWGDLVYCRTKIASSQGRGIELWAPWMKNAIPDAPLYTKAIENRIEFRAHVLNGEVFDFVQKKAMGAEKLKELGLEEPDYNIRSHKRGWVFARNNLRWPEYHDTVKKVAVDAVVALGLDFGAVDMFATSNGLVFVCEVNTAPGLVGSTKENYHEALLRYSKLVEANV